ncbi:MAG TPA: hypothetical protein VK364_13235 [Hymenobacter sp.]|nr:hypothetical protein [Hymenobacter sp.]
MLAISSQVTWLSGASDVAEWSVLVLVLDGGAAEAGEPSEGVFHDSAPGHGYEAPWPGRAADQFVAQPERGQVPSKAAAVAIIRQHRVPVSSSSWPLRPLTNLPHPSPGARKCAAPGARFGCRRTAVTGTLGGRAPPGPGC